MNAIISIRYIILPYPLKSEEVSIGLPFILLNKHLNINHPVLYEVDTNH